MAENSLQQIFQTRNLESRDNWLAFAAHRNRMMQLLEQHSPPQGESLCILGAGNTNDIDLPRLRMRFSSITLADIDEAAMRLGIEKQLGPGPWNHIRVVSLDVTGAMETLNRLAQAQGGPSTADLDSLMALILNCPALALIERRFDCVVSTCLLSQLIDAVKSAIGESHVFFVPLVKAIRRQHLETVVALTASQGLAAIVFDFVSSLTCPGLEQIVERELPDYAAAQVARRNFFTGLNPQKMRETLESVLQPRENPAKISTTSPWLWNQGPRTYLVEALICRLG